MCLQCMYFQDYDCNDNSPGTWCSGNSEMKIVISRHGWGSQVGHNIHLKVSQKGKTFPYKSAKNIVLISRYGQPRPSI